MRVGEKPFDILSIVRFVSADQVLTDVRQSFVEPAFFRPSVANEHVLVEAEEVLKFMGKHGIGDVGIVEWIDKEQVDLVAVAALVLRQDRRGVEESAYRGGIITDFVNQVGVEQVNPPNVPRTRIAYERGRDNGMDLCAE